MKKVILSLLMMIAVTLSYAQSPKENLKKDFNAYIGYSIKKDFKKSMEYIVDDFFEVVPKDQMIKQFEQVFNDPGLKIKLESPKILEIGNLEKIDQKHYAIITYSNVLKMKVLRKNESETEEDLKRKAALLKASVSKQSGVQSVKFDEKNHAFEAKVIEKVCGVSANGNNGWKFVKLDKDITFIIEKFLPKAIIDKI